MSFHHKASQFDATGGSLAETQIPDSIFLPIAMNLSDAQTYTGFSRKHLDELINSGKLVRRRLGPKGTFIVLRSQLDAALEEAFNNGSEGIEGDFSFA
ncbi:hypothetical protein GRI58_15375 [Porphyrobacter algicida]|uniref:Helix-turn-helix domain-containing protein n=1 Tax=Qipengyuania algicida TaxID=1836209 RepID=A0A845AIV5_9SPHN|nr:helix-turn-helix domain-containing protein [Qipengyuania algicida]MXP30190.1 hypothetical protein [Qipengyuania algicida]